MADHLALAEETSINLNTLQNWYIIIILCIGASAMCAYELKTSKPFRVSYVTAF